jgi:hypothetical protein
VDDVAHWRPHNSKGTQELQSLREELCAIQYLLCEARLVEKPQKE